MRSSQSFKKRVLASAIASYALLGGAAYAQQTEGNIEEVVVLGVKGAQQSAINTKREAKTIVDGISSEDIGKLPDATITDSLQRITGVQIERTAGEGGSLSVRGMQQVGVMLNGEQFLASGNIFSAQPNFSDIPAQLLRAADVYKSLDVRNASSGITGTINLKTFRPFDFKEGFTAAGGWELSRGEITETNDNTYNALLNYRNDNVGAMVSVVTGDKILGNDYVGNYNPDNWPNQLKMGPGSPFAGQWTAAPFFGLIAQQQENERERSGINGALQADLGNGFKFLAEGFYTKAKEYRRSVGLSMSNRWKGLDSLDPATQSLWDPSAYIGAWTGFPETAPTHAAKTVTGKDGRTWVIPDQFDAKILWIQSLTTNEVTDSSSKNFNVELSYDNGGPFTASLRATNARSSHESLNATGQAGLNSFFGNTIQNFKGTGVFYPNDVIKNYNLTLDPSRAGQVGAKGGQFVLPNPKGYDSDPNLQLRMKNSHFIWSGFDTPIAGGLTDTSGQKGLGSYLGNKDSWIYEGIQLEGFNHDDTANLRTFSAKADYKFEDSFVTNVEVGLRNSSRTVNNYTYDYVAQFYKGSPNNSGGTDVEGCYAQWRSIDTPFDGWNCSAGEQVSGNFVPYTALVPQSLDHNGEKLRYVTSLGKYVKGIPGFWAVDPHTYDDPVAYNRKVFGNIERAYDADQSYGMTLNENSGYVQGDFKADIISGTLGVRVIDTELLADVNVTGPDFPHTNITPSEGKQRLSHDYRYVLPSLNLAADVTDNIKLRFAAAKNKQELDLNNYAASLQVYTGTDPSNPTVRYPTSFASGGNINLKPWLSKNYDFSAEYYMGEASMVSLGLFLVQIDSYTASSAGHTLTVDYLGKKYTITGTQLGQAGNGEVKGVELGSKFALSDFVGGDSFLNNVGLEANFTYSPSSQDGTSKSTDLAGEKYPFPNNSEQTYNLAVWYQKDKLQARIAFNGRSERFITDNGYGPNGISIWAAPESYVDANLSYDVMDGVTVFLQGQNLTSTDQKREIRFKEGVTQSLNVYDYEARYSLGVRAKF